MTFGYELEFLNARIDAIGKKENITFQQRGMAPLDYRGFTLQTELGVTEDIWKGGELISPVYNHYYLCLKELKDMLKILKENYALLERDSNRTSFQVSLSKNIFANDFEKYYVFLVFWLTFQNEIMEQAKGENKKLRYGASFYATPLDGKIMEK